MNGGAVAGGYPNVGIFLNGYRMTPGAMAEWGARAERSGIESVWVAEAFGDPFIPLALIAERTSRIRFGPACALAGRHPYALCTGLTALDAISAGRVAVGMSDGPSGMKRTWYGDPPAKPVRRMREYVEALKLMLSSHSGVTSEYSGEYYRFQHFERFDVPVRPTIPVFIGATRPGMLRLAGELADGVITPALTSELSLETVTLPNVREGLEASGRDRAGFETLSLRICCVHEDEREARRRAKALVLHYVGIAPALAAVLDLHGLQDVRERVADAFLHGERERAASLLPDEVVDLVSISGTADTCRRRVGELGRLTDTVILFPPSVGLSEDEADATLEAILDAFSTTPDAVRPTGEGKP